ncbi:MAG TPA: HEAT repeat domain-containing protein [Allosphingosinicella sp.]|jgi:hypothetical protein|nr:HEAT repeat domain-containing protein [Allosphingosinicella sp.]
MAERYLPPSSFLRAIVADEVPLAGSDVADATLCRLIDMTRDEHAVNRDWATLLLAQAEVDTPEVRDALLRAAQDEHDGVRAEAILGLAMRDKALALPLLRKELAGEAVSMPVFEAAALVADPSLVEDLRAFVLPSEDAFLDRYAREALEACETGRPA